MPRAYLKPLRFRFTHPEDVSLFSDGWYVYNEQRISEMPARVLADLESELNMPLIDVMNGVRDSTVMGDLGASWLGVKLDMDERGEKCPPFADFNVHTMLMDWEAAPESEGKDEAPASPSSDSMPTPTAALPTLPAVVQPG